MELAWKPYDPEIAALIVLRVRTIANRFGYLVPRLPDMPDYLMFIPEDALATWATDCRTDDGLAQSGALAAHGLTFVWEDRFSAEVEADNLRRALAAGVRFVEIRELSAEDVAARAGTGWTG